MYRPKFVLLITLFAALAATAAAQRATPVAAAKSFYAYDRAHSQTFNRRNVNARKTWFSDELYSLFRNELRREDAYLKKNSTNKPYFGDGGFGFRPLDENCGTGGKRPGRRLTIKPAFQKGNRAAVTAIFAFPKPCKDPDTTTYTIGLIKGKGGWLIDDVNYGDVRTLKGDLKRKEY